MDKLFIYLAVAAAIIIGYAISLRSKSCPICLGMGMVRNRYFVSDDQPCGRCRGTGQVS